MAPTDEYMDIKRDLDRMKKLFSRLTLKKEQEVILMRMGKRLPASEVRDMREIEDLIFTILGRKAAITSLQQRNLLETFKHQFQSSMRSWRNRLSYAEQTRARKKKDD